MDRIGILKWLKIFAICFISLLILEIITLFLFLNITINLESEEISLFRLILSSDFISFTDTLLYLFLMIISFFFLIFSIFLLHLTIKKKIENINLSKLILMVGLFLLVGNFIKLEYFFMLSNARVEASTTYIFINIIYNHSITPLIGALMWNYSLIISSALIISGLIFGGVGLQWFLKLEKEIDKNRN